MANGTNDPILESNAAFRLSGADGTLHCASTTSRSRRVGGCGRTGPTDYNLRMELARFRFREDVLRAAASRTRRRLAVSLLATGALAALLWVLVLRPRGASAGTLAFALALLAILGLLSLRRRLRRLLARWSSFELTIDAASVGRVVEGFPPVRIPRAEVRSVEESAAGVVVRSRGGATLLVPRELDGYERARATLAEWAAPAGA